MIAFPTRPFLPVLPPMLKRKGNIYGCLGLFLLQVACRHANISFGLLFCQIHEINFSYTKNDNLWIVYFVSMRGLDQIIISYKHRVHCYNLCLSSFYMIEIYAYN